MEKHPIGEFTDSTMQKIREMVDVNTIIGDPVITQDGVTVIPVSRVSFGFLSGGTDFTKETAKGTNFGCGTGTGVTIAPVGFLIVKNGEVKLITMNAPANSTLDRVVELVPQVMEKVSEWRDKGKDEE